MQNLSEVVNSGPLFTTRYTLLNYILIFEENVDNQIFHLKNSLELENTT